MKASASSAYWVRMKNPAVRGQLRSRSWQMVLPPTGDDDPVWAKRARDYWLLQERKYGLRFSNFTNNFGELDGGLFCTTYATVMDVLPGERVSMRVWSERKLKEGGQHATEKF